MTIPQKPTDDNDPDYYEYHYGYILPEINLTESLTPEDANSLTPLELAFVKWHMETNNSEMAIERLIHPAKYFNKETHGAKIVGNRPHVNDILQKLRKSNPYLTLYNAQYISKLLHEEIEHLRKNNRERRFYGPAAKQEMFGKKSKHEEEMLEINLLLRCVELLGNMSQAVRGMKDAPDTKSGNQNSSIDRVLSEAQKLINESQTRING